VLEQALVSSCAAAVQVFNAAINELLLHPDWELWSRRVLPRYLYADEDWKLPVEQHMEWYAEVMEQKAQRAKKKEEREAAAAAAAAEATAGAEVETEAAASQAEKQPVDS
jgi:hypothetical protein